MTRENVQFSNILVAIDGSEQSTKAAEYAISITKKYNAQLIALCVIDVSRITPDSSIFVTSPIYPLVALEGLREQAQQWLDKIGKLAEPFNIHFKSEIDQSTSVAATIIDYAERNNINLIVLGTKGRSGFKKLLLGSVASGVITYAYCPVIVIK